MKLGISGRGATSPRMTWRDELGLFAVAFLWRIFTRGQRARVES